MVCVKWRVFSKQQLIPTKFNRPGNLKGVTGFKKQTELYPYKCRSKSPTSSTLTFKKRKEQLEEALYNLLSDNVYLLFVSFCRFHENFGLN